MRVDYNEEGVGHCEIYQYRETMMNSRQLLEWMWQPRLESPVTFMGPQCLSEARQNVYGFKGYGADGIPWQTFFDASTRLAIKGFSGSGNPEETGGSTLITFTVDEHKPIQQFTNEADEFYPRECVSNYKIEIVDEVLLPVVDYGLLFL